MQGSYWNTIFLCLLFSQAVVIAELIPHSLLFFAEFRKPWEEFETDCSVTSFGDDCSYQLRSEVL